MTLGLAAAMSNADEPTKLLSQAWSTATLQEGIQALHNQQVKTEDDTDLLAMEARLEDCDLDIRLQYS